MHHVPSKSNVTADSFQYCAWTLPSCRAARATVAFWGQRAFSVTLRKPESRRGEQAAEAGRCQSNSPSKPALAARKFRGARITWNGQYLAIFKTTKWQFHVNLNRQIHLRRLKNAPENALGHTTPKSGTVGSQRGDAWHQCTLNPDEPLLPLSLSCIRAQKKERKKKDCFLKVPQPKRNK